MSKKSCKGCYFYGDCPGRKICEGYTPVTEEGEDFETQLVIRNGRREFREDWNQYITYILEPYKFENTNTKNILD